MNESFRRDPDALVERIRQEEQKAARGRLRIYFGSSAGVGKTYAMLVSARTLKSAGTDVVAGVIETHGRTDTAGQEAGLEVLPRQSIKAPGGMTLTEFDLDGALARKPALILVDELAHSNVAGSRHPKRWQDVDELLASGIDVWTTLNVQHLESLNDVVGGITGVRVQETLPDTFFDRADEIVLVDTPADELLARLKAGKVYGEVQAERAAANFFRKGNLMALRELALRRTADRVEDDVQTYRSDRSIDRVWKTESAILCCIGPSGAAEHVVRSAALLAQQLAVSWHAVYVETPALQRLPEQRRGRILESVKLAEELGATTAILPSGNVAGAVVDYARENNLSKMVMGHNQASIWRPAGTLAQQLGKLAADVDLIEVGVPVATASRRIACTSPAARLCTATSPVSGPGAAASCAGRPVTRGSSRRWMRAADTSTAWASAAVTWSQCAARSIPWKPAVPVNRPSRNAGESVTPSSARPIAAVSAPAARSAWVRTGPATRNETGACSIRGAGRPPVAALSRPSTPARMSSPRAQAAV